MILSQTVQNTGDEPRGHVPASEALAPFQVRREKGSTYCTLVSEINSLGMAVGEPSRFPSDPEIRYVIVDAQNREVLPDAPVEMIDPATANENDLPF